MNLRIAEDPSPAGIEYDQGIKPLAPGKRRAAHQHITPGGASFGGDGLKSGVDLCARYLVKVAIISCHRAFGKQDDLGARLGRGMDDISNAGNVFTDGSTELHLCHSDGEPIPVHIPLPFTKFIARSASFVLWLWPNTAGI